MATTPKKLTDYARDVNKCLDGLEATSGRKAVAQSAHLSLSILLDDALRLYHDRKRILDRLKELTEENA